MSAQENATVARSLYEAFNAKDFKRIQSLCDPDAISTLVPFGVRKGIPEVFRMWAEGFPDGKIEVRTLIASDDSVVCEFIGRGTQTGTLRGLAGVIPPTGRHAELSFCDCLDIADGKVVGARSYFDALGFMQQLGLLSPQPTVKEREPVPVGAH